VAVALGWRRRSLEAARLWLTSALSDVALPANAVALAPVNASSGTGPRFSIQILAQGAVRGGHGDIHTYGGRYLVSSVDSILRVYAFGEQAIEWLDLAVSRILADTVRDALEASTRGAEHFVIEGFSEAITESSLLLDSDTEPRAFFDVIVSCRRVVDVVMLDLEQVDIDMAVGGDPPDDAIVEDVNVELPE
jgi:hypothetical protein